MKKLRAGICFISFAKEKTPRTHITHMPNGKGQLDCSYCVHFDGNGYPDGHGEERFCSFHETLLPKARVASDNRICGHFVPNECFQASTSRPQFRTIAMRFAAFGEYLEPGVLYEFGYNHPPGISRLAALRTADYKNDTWTKPLIRTAA